jgi:hypothetical protein
MQNTQTIESSQLFELAKNWKVSKSGRKCKLAEYNDTIKYLRSARHFSTKQIHKFLNENGVKVSYPTIVNYINRKK